MSQSGDPADAERRVFLHEKFAHLRASPPIPRVALAPRPPIDAFEGAALMRARTRASGTRRWVFVTATAFSTAVASTLAVAITLVAVNQEPLGAPPGFEASPAAGATAAPAPAVPAVVASSGPAAPARQISLRPIGAPNQPLQLEPQRPASLPLQIEPDGAAGEPFILTLAGAPAGTILFGADRIGSDVWILPPGAASRLEIVLPEWSSQVFEIAVVLRRTSGLVAARTTAFIAVPPPADAAPAPPPAAETGAGDLTRDLLAKADRLIARGDIVGARALYQRAADLGSAPAALALGTTYDPNRMWSLGVLGLAGNRERARQWYVRASDLGNAEAKARLTALGF